jgi:hypothetical protein
MTYATGSLITAADLNNYLSTVRTIYGTGTGDRGYGQTTYSQAAVSAGGTINAAHWAALTNMYNACATHQGSGSTYTAPATTGRASILSSLASNITAIDTNRLTAATSDMTLASSAGSSVRSGSWGTNISTVVDVTWTNEDSARFFFNSGGQIRIRMSQPAGTGQDTVWSTIFSSVGTITIGANTSSRSGTAGTLTSYGYYQMPSAQSIMVNGTDVGTGAYATNDMLVYVNRLNYVGTNGGNGSGFRIQINLQDQHTGGADTVGTGTSALFDVYRCTSTLTGIAAPTFAVNQAWTVY